MSLPSAGSKRTSISSRKGPKLKCTNPLFCSNKCVVSPPRPCSKLALTPYRLLLQVDDLIKHNEALSSQAHEFQNRCCAAATCPRLVTQPLPPPTRVHSRALQSHVVTQCMQTLTHSQIPADTCHLGLLLRSHEEIFQGHGQAAAAVRCSSSARIL